MLGGTSGTSGTPEKDKGRRCFSKPPATNPETVAARAWLLQFLDRAPIEVWTGPPATHGEVLALYPGAVAAEPVPEHVTRTPTDGERDELLALIAAVYAADTDQDRQEAIGLALADPEGALACYRAIAAERAIVVSASPVSATVSAQNVAAERGIVVTRAEVTRSVTTKTHVQACKTCRHLARPGRADGYCAERTDLPHAYGADHPLRRLPADGGANCPKWAPND
ncbi:MAG: hypothetical protein JNK52_15445 [Zoogloeaceae bacterium]|nr:hypothetical protein [Zoogloeaceae bacterium]